MEKVARITIILFNNGTSELYLSLIRNGVGDVRSFASEHIRNAVHFK